MGALDAVVVGAGTAGLAAARVLREAGWDVRVLEKSRGLGGRAATRRIGEQPVDFGAQFFTARSEEFAGRVREWEAHGLCRVWTRDFVRWPESGIGTPAADGHERFCAPDGLTAVAKFEARGLEVLRESRVVSIAERGGEVEVRCENGDMHAAGRVLLTAPAPQSLAIAGDLAQPGTAAELGGLKYAPCFSLIVRLPNFSPPWAGIQSRHPVLEWLAADDTRRDAPRHLFVLHSTAGFAIEYFERGREEVAAAMLGAAENITGAGFSRARVEHFHRWRYARVENPLPLPRFRAVDEGRRIFFAGDAFGEPKLESAWLSGRAAAGAMLGE